MPRGFFYDNTRCTGCRTCVIACKDYHDHGPDMAFRMVIDYEGGSWQPDVDGTFSQDAFAYHVSISCNHCNNPVCTRVCPTGAIVVRNDTKKVWKELAREDTQVWPR